MSGTILIVAGVAFVATCIWLMVRIINRRERWSKWTLAIVVGVPVLYSAAFGPACWITSRTDCGAAELAIAYKPITWAMSPDNDSTVSHLMNWYAEVGAPRGWCLAATEIFQQSPDGNWTLRFDDWCWQRDMQRD